MFAIQALERLEFVHSKGIIHKDIAPANFVIGRENPVIIYLIDFGFSHKYKSSRTGKHLAQKNKHFIFGNLRFKSISSNKGYEESRRDDLESLAYTIIFLAKKKLPWEEVLFYNISEKVKSKIVCQMKETIRTKDLCKGLPEEIGHYLDYCKKLTFEENPDYEKLKFFFLTILIKKKLKNDLKFSYLNREYCSSLDNIKRDISSSRKKKKNLFDKIFSSYRDKISRENSILSKEKVFKPDVFLNNKKTNLNIIIPSITKDNITILSAQDIDKSRWGRRNINIRNTMFKKEFKTFSKKDTKKKIIEIKSSLHPFNSIKFISYPKILIINQTNYSFNKQRKKRNLNNETKPLFDNNTTRTCLNYKGKLFKGMLEKRLLREKRNNTIIANNKNELKSKIIRSNKSQLKCKVFKPNLNLKNRRNISLGRISDRFNFNNLKIHFRSYTPQTLRNTKK